MMRVRFTRIANYELEDAVQYYELEYSGLGYRFKQEVKKALLRIAENPLAWSIERGELRKYLMHNFPYKLIYFVEEDYILVLAVAHQHRKPDYWIDNDRT